RPGRAPSPGWWAPTTTPACACSPPRGCSSTTAAPTTTPPRPRPARAPGTGRPSAGEPPSRAGGTLEFRRWRADGRKGYCAQADHRAAPRASFAVFSAVSDTFVPHDAAEELDVTGSGRA